MPQAGAGEVLLRVRASGVNRPDALQRRGLYPPPAGASDIPGLEVCGDIVSGDLSGTDLRLGDTVCALVSGGGYAEYCVAPTGQCLPLPRGLSPEEGAALPETAFTVWHNVFERGHLQPGQTLLVQGGSSGIGTMAIQLAVASGARVVATAGSDEKCAACIKLGAELAIHYRTQDFVEAVQVHTAQRGADVILDMVAGSYLAREQRCLAEEGRLVVIAVQGGREGGNRRRCADAQAPDPDGLDAARAQRGLQERPRAGRAQNGVALDRARAGAPCGRHRFPG